MQQNRDEVLRCGWSVGCDLLKAAVLRGIHDPSRQSKRDFGRDPWRHRRLRCPRCLRGFVLFRSYERLARRSLRRKYAGLQIHEVPVAGDVTLTYHTYHGLIAWFTQTPHYVSLPPDHARILLGRLFRFNLTWGLLTYGALFIPPLAVWNYFTQRRSISSQEAGNAIGANAAPATSGDVEGTPTLRHKRPQPIRSRLDRSFTGRSAGLAPFFA